MFLRIIILISFLFVVKILSAQNLSWARSMEGTPTAPGSQGYSVVVDKAGNVYITGRFSGTVDFDPSAGTSYLTCNGILNAYILKLNASGNLVWVRSIDGNGSSEGTSIKLDSFGNIYSTGEFKETFDFDPGSGTYTLASVGSFSAYILKLDTAGNFIWAKKMGGSANDNAWSSSMACDASGNIYTCGRFYGTIDFDPGSGVYNLTASSFNIDDIFITKLDSGGNFVWAEKIGGSGVDRGNFITVSPSGNIYLTGSFNDTVDFDPGTSTFMLNSAGNYDAFIAKYNNTGNLIWANNMGGAAVDAGSSIAFDTMGNVYTAGQFAGTADFDPGSGTYYLSTTSSLVSAAFISKLDSNGNFMMARQLGGAAGTLYAYVASIWIGDSGNIYTTGSYQGTVDFDPGSGTFNKTSVGANRLNIFISKLDVSGNFVWVVALGGSSNGFSIRTDKEGNVYVTGSFYGTIDFDPGPATYNLTASFNDIFVLKLCPSPGLSGNISGPTTVCSGKSYTYTINPAYRATGYNWILPPGTTIDSGQNTLSITVRFGTALGKIKVTPYNSCSNGSTDSLSLTIIPPPPLWFSTLPDSTIIRCIADSLQFKAQGDTSFLSYTWYIYDSTNTITDSAFGKNPVLRLTNGKHKVMLRAGNPNTQCEIYTSYIDSVYITRYPGVNASIDSAKISCGKHTVFIHYSSAYADSMKVDWGDGTYIPWHAATGNFTAMHEYYDSSKVYSIKVLAKNTICNTIVILKDTIVIAPKPIAKFFADNSSKTFPIKGCSVLNVDLADSSKNADSVWYKLRNGIIDKLLKVHDMLQDTGWFNIIQYVTNKDGCLDSLIVNNAVYVSPKPVLTIVKDSVYPRCNQNYLRLKITSSFSDQIIINWGDGNTNLLPGAISGISSDTITHYYALPGYYKVRIENKNSYCSVVDSISHMVRNPFQITASNDTTACKGQIVGLWIIASGADSLFTYIFKSPSNTLQNASGIFLVTPDSTITYNIGAINACYGDTLWKQITITVRPPLKLQLNTTDTILCKSSVFTLKASATGGTGKYDFFLKKNNILQQTNTTGSFNITVNSNETFTVVVSDNCTPVKDSLQCDIKVFNELKFNQTQADVYLCEGETLTLKANTNKGSGKVSYEWKDGGGNILSLLDSLYFIPNISTLIILKVTDDCTSIYDSIWVYEFAVSTGSLLGSDVLSGCIPLTVNLETPTLTYSNSQPYEVAWDFGDGNFATQNFDNTTSVLKSKHTYTLTGTYPVKAELRFKNSSIVCKTFTTIIDVLLVPQIILSISPKKITLPGTKCTATLITSNGDSVVIAWGDGYSDYFNTNVNLITQSHDYSDTGHYIVKATAYNKNSCYTETQAGVYFADTFSCYIPNAFSPDKDATNEVFKPIMTYCKSYELTIFNRWGEVVYEAKYIAGKTPEPFWTGEGNASGTYIYILTARDADNIRHNFKGTVMLIR